MTTSDESSQTSSTTLSRIAPLAFVLMNSLAAGGVEYGFGLFANDIRLLHHLSQDQINTISSVTFCSGIFSWVPGLVLDYFGIRFAFLVAATMCLVSGLQFWSIARAPYDPDDDKNFLIAQLSVLGMILFMGATMTSGCGFKTVALLSDPKQEGSIIGIAKGYTGIGAGAYTCIFEALRRHRNSGVILGGATALTVLDESNLGYLLVAGVGTALLTFPALWFIPSHRVMEGPMKIVGTFTSAHTNVMYAGLVLLAAGVLVTSSRFVDDSNGDNHADVDAGDITVSPTLNDEFLNNYGYYVAAAIVILWVAPASIVATCMAEPAASSEHNNNNNGGSIMNDVEDSIASDMEKQRQPSSERTALLKQASTAITELAESFYGDEHDDGNITTISSDKKSDLSLFQALQTPELWLMFHCTVIVVGSGTVITNNVSAIVESRMLPSNMTSVATSVFSVAQSASRVIAGLLTEVAAKNHAKNKKVASGSLDWFGWHSRPSFLSLAAFIGALAHGILAIPGLGSGGFIVGVALSGIAFGTVWPVMVLVVGDVFGKANLGAIYLWFDGSTLAFGSLFLSKLLSQYVYEQHRLYPNLDAMGDADTSSCFGDGCFQLTHIIITLLCLAATVSPIELSRRTHNRSIR